MRLKVILIFIASVFLLSVAACSPRIYGTVRLVDADMNPITSDTPEGTVINMINTTASLESASHSAVVNKEGNFESAKNSIKPGLYKVEANRIGYVTETQTLEVGRFSGKKAEFNLKKIRETKRKSIEGSKSDEDKIINPGEVNIQPPTM